MNITDLEIKTEPWPQNLAKIVTINSLESIPDADKIVLASMEENAWKCVVKKDDFKIGDLAVYFCIDSVVDSSNPALAFMEARKFRIWNAKFKGVPSQGLLMPVSMLEFYGIDISKIKPDDDVTRETKTIHYEKPLDIKLQGEARGGLPTNIGFRKTDETNLLSCRQKVLAELVGNRWYSSIKRDGSSTSFVYNNGDFQACSRSLSMKEGNGYPWVVANKFGIKEKMISLGGNYIIQGETTGPKFNGNRLGLKDIEFHVFNIFDIDTKTYFGLYNLRFFCDKIGLNMVDVIEEEEFNQEIHTIEYFQEMANKVKYSNGEAGEGIVLRPVIPFYSYNLQKEWSVKIINQNYKQ